MYALNANTTGNYSTAVGYQAGYKNTTGQITVVGVGALNNNTTGSNNNSVGVNALAANTTGSYNIAMGDSALTSNTTASNNTAVGYQAGYSQTTGGAGGGYNTFIGQTAGYSATGYNNTFIGQGTGYNTTGNNNTFIGMANTGYSSGALVTTGSSNTILGGFNGNQGGLDIRTSSNYIVLSDGAGNPRGVFDGGGNLFVGATSSSFSSPRIYAQTTLNGVVGYTTSTLGYTASAYRIDNTAAYFSLFYYNTWATSVGSINTNGTTTSYNITSDRRLKENITSFTNGLEVISALKPSQYNYISDKNTVYQGFIADELQAVVPHAVTGEVNAVNEEGKPIYQGVDASFLIPHLVSAIQELNAKVTALEAQLGAK